MVAVTGRFQPFHNDHLELVLSAHATGESVTVGITNPDPRSLEPLVGSNHRHLLSANPLTYWERARLIRAALIEAGLPVTHFDVVPFPLDAIDVCSSYVPLETTQVVRVYAEWERQKVRRLETAGYPVKVLVGDQGRRVSGTDIRAAIVSNQPWNHWVPPAVFEELQRMLGNALVSRFSGAVA